VPWPPEPAFLFWYQYYFRHPEVGKAGYAKYLDQFNKFIWHQASPKWTFDDATYGRTAASFNNPDHVDIVMHDYRWRLGLADGERKYDDLEKQLAALPPITVPTITMEGDANGAIHAPSAQPIATGSRANMSTASSPAASATTCRRKPRKPLPKTQVEALAKYAARASFADLSAQSRKQLPVHILDSIGCCIAALGAGPIEACRAQVADFGVMVRVR
jgi:hypothetical protein